MINLKENYTFDELLEIVSILRSENGCKWDRAQTHESLLRYLIEESYEYIEATRKKDAKMQADELGDVLLQVVLHAQIGKENKTFDINDVINAVCRKMIIRHPHVFADAKADSVEEVLDNWEKIKKKEKGEKTDKQVFESVSRELPALIRAQKIAEKAKNLQKKYDFGEETIDKLFKMIDNKNVDKSAEDKAEFIGKTILALAAYAAKEKLQAELCVNDCIDDIIALSELTDSGEQR